MSEIEGGNVRGQPPVKWRDRVQEYVREKGEGSLRNLQQARRECQDRERWQLFCRGHPLVGAPRIGSSSPPLPADKGGMEEPRYKNQGKEGTLNKVEGEKGEEGVESGCLGKR